MDTEIMFKTILLMLSAYVITPLYLAIVFGIEIGVLAAVILLAAIVYSNIRYYIRSATGFQ